MWAELLDIHQAAEEGNIEAVKQAIANGADVNAKGVNAKGVKDGRTPLHLAALMGYKEIAELLITKGADVNAKDEDGATPLDGADDETFDLLRKHGGKHGTIHSAVIDGDIEAVKDFLAAGTDVNARDKMGHIPLHFAKNKEIAELLIAEGADVNAKTKYNGRTPLDLAGWRTSDLLRKHGGKTWEELEAAGN